MRQSNTRTAWVALTAAAGLLLGACATNEGYLSPNTGRALQEAYAKQIVDPNPAVGAPSVTPEVAAAAIQRYLDGEVKDPTPPKTSISVED